MAERFREILFAGIQAGGGAALAVYTYERSASPYWSIAYSGVGLAGTFNIIKSVIKIFQNPRNVRCESCKVRNVVSGTLVHFGSLYGFSEAWKCNNRQLWIRCLVMAASGFYFAVSSMNNLGICSNHEPKLKFCQLAFEPVLSICGTIYLSYFRSHEDEYLFWVPIFVTGATGLKVAISGFSRIVYKRHYRKLLLKSIEIAIGGWLLTISSTVLAFYGLRKEFPPSWRILMMAGECVGVVIIFNSIMSILQYFDLEDNVLKCFGGMMTGFILFLWGCLFFKCMGPNGTALLMFLFLVGNGCHLLRLSFKDLYRLLPRARFNRYCQRVLSPLLALYSSAASAYIGYRMGWRFSLPTMTFAAAGVYFAYKGFSKGLKKILDGNVIY